MAEASVERFESLLAPRGRELLDHLATEAAAADTPLRLGTVLRSRYPADLVAEALAQHELRLLARAKFSRAMEMFFTRPGLEQASSEVVARHRAARYRAAGRVADLCCGIGGDLIVLAEDPCMPAEDPRIARRDLRAPAGDPRVPAEDHRAPAEIAACRPRIPGLRTAGGSPARRPGAAMCSPSTATRCTSASPGPMPRSAASPGT